MNNGAGAWKLVKGLALGVSVDIGICKVATGLVYRLGYLAVS